MRDPDGTVLVTGASGFVGSHLVERLAQSGTKVRALLRGASNERWLRDVANVEVHRAALSDITALSKATAGVSTVFHLAAVTSAPREVDYFSANVGGTRSVIEAMRRSAPDATLVLCSSQAAAGPSREGKALNEKDTPEPIGPYGKSKLEAEHVAFNSGLRTVVVRPPTVYGPRERDMLEMFRWAARGLVPLVGRYEQRVNLIHVNDLDTALIAAVAAPSGSLFFVTDGRVYDRNDILREIASAVSRTPTVIRLPVSLAHTFAQLSRFAAGVTGAKPLLTPERINNMCLDWICDDSLARTQLGYRSEVPIEKGMKETAAWYREHGWI